MYNSWYYVRELAKNLNLQLKGIVFQAAFTYKKSEMYLPFSGHDKMQCLHMVIKNPVPYFMPENNTPRQQQVVKLLKPLTGSTVDKILYHQNDRQILFVLNNGGLYLLVQIFGINGNVFLLDENFQMIENFKKRRNCEIPEFSSFIDEDQRVLPIPWQDYFQTHENKSVFKFLKLLPYKFFSENLRKEICYRAGLDKNQLIYNLSKDDKVKLRAAVEKILGEMNAPVYRLYISDRPVMSLITLSHLSQEAEKFEDFFDLLRHYISSSFQDYGFIKGKKDLLSRMGNYYNVIEKRLTKSRKSLAELPDSDIYRQYGEAILINVYQIKKGQKEVKLPNYQEDGGFFRIALDPRLTPSQNADQYFKKAHKIEGALEELTKSTVHFSAEKEELQQLITRLENAETYEQLKTIEVLMPAEVKHQTVRDENNTRVPYKKYYYKSWEILVGKSARDNDELTLKVASKMDFWLHASKVAGSHVIVKNPEKKESLPEEVLFYAAGLAAFFSKLKNSKVVPVNYTKKKYVVKRKKMLPGQVFINFERTVIVEPRDPKTA